MRASSSAVYVVCKAAFLIGNRLSAIGAMLLLLAIPAFADYYYVCLPPPSSFGGGNHLTRRTGPGSWYFAIGPISDGTVVEVTQQNDGWFDIRDPITGQNLGWVDRQRICRNSP